MTSKNATIHWTAGVDVTHFLIESTEEETRRDITANEKNAGQATLTGLKAATTYKVSIYNNQKLRGNCKFETTEDFPEGYNIANLKEGDDIDAVLAEQQGDVVLVFPAGSFRTYGKTQHSRIGKCNYLLGRLRWDTA